MNVLCQNDECFVILNSKCVFYEGEVLSESGINTNDSIQVAIQKLNDAIGDGGGTSIQFQYNTVNLGNNQADTVNFTGSGVSASRIGDTVTVTINTGGGAGTVTSFSAGSLNPLFTSNVVNAMTTPALTFSLSNAAANTYFGNSTGSPASPSYVSAGTLTKTDDTNVILSLGGNPATSLLRAVSLTLSWNGQLSIARGGTGLATLGSALQAIRVNAGGTNLEYYTPGSGTGTVTTVSVVTANGISGIVANDSTTPAITLTLGAITPSSVVSSGTIAGSNLSGTNTGDQTITLSGDITGSGTGAFATTLATVNSNTGTFGSSTQVGVFTVNGKGLITAAGNATITPTVGSITGLGSGVATWLGTPSWSNFNIAVTGTAPFWSLASGGTFTGANILTGTTTNTLKLVFAGLNTTQVNGAGLWLSNTSAAINGTQQNSPSNTFEGFGFETTGSSSQSLKFTNYLAPVQAATAGGLLTWAASVNLGGYTTRMSLGTDGAFAITSTITATFATFTSGNGISVRLNGTGSVFLGSTTSARIGSATSGSATFSNSGASLSYQADTSHFFATASAPSLSTGSATLYSFSAAGFSGGTSTQTGTFMSFTPVINVTGGTNIIRALVYDPTLTNVTGVASHYGLLIGPSACLNGLGTLTPTAVLDIAASTTVRSSFRIRSGVAPSSPNDGDIWYTGTDIFIRVGGTTKTFTIV